MKRRGRCSHQQECAGRGNGDGPEMRGPTCERQCADNGSRSRRTLQLSQDSFEYFLIGVWATGGSGMSQTVRNPSSDVEKLGGRMLVRRHWQAKGKIPQILQQVVQSVKIGSPVLPHPIPEGK